MISSPFGKAKVPGFWIASIAATCLTCAGCGLAEYESRMEQQQKKIHYAEEQNLNLEPHKLLLPDRGKAGKDEDQVAKEEFFMRPPKGIAGVTDEKIIGNDIAEFPVTGVTPIQKMWVAAVKRDSEVKFQKDVLELLNIKSRKKTPKMVKGLQDLNYDWYHDDQGSKGCYDAYFFQKSVTSTQIKPYYLVAVVFKTEGGKEVLPTQIDYALASLRLGSEAKKEKVGKTAPAVKTTKK